MSFQISADGKTLSIDLASLAKNQRKSQKAIKPGSKKPALNAKKQIAKPSGKKTIIKKAKAPPVAEKKKQKKKKSKFIRLSDPFVPLSLAVVRRPPKIEPKHLTNRPKVAKAAAKPKAKAKAPTKKKTPAKKVEEAASAEPAVEAAPAASE